MSSYLTAQFNPTHTFQAQYYKNNTFQCRDRFLPNTVRNESELIKESQSSFSAPEGSVSNRVLIHYYGKFFSALKFNLGSGIEEENIWIDRITVADPVEWPGLNLINNTESHAQYLFGYLLADETSSEPESDFALFVNMLTRSNMNRTCIALSFQAVSSENKIILFAHCSDPSGFGTSLNGVEIGVYYLDFYLMSSSEYLAEILQQWITCAHLEVNELNKKLIKSEEFIKILIKTWSELKIESNFINLQKTDHSISYEPNRKLQEEFFFNKFVKEQQIDFEKILFDKKIEVLCAQNISLERELSYEREKNNDLRLQNEELKYMKEEKIELQQKSKDKNKVLIEDAVSAERNRFIEELESKTNCTICMIEVKRVAFLPCGHSLYCVDCFESLGLSLNKRLPKNSIHSACAYCETPIKKAVKINYF